MLRQKDPQRIHLPQQATSKPSGVIAAVMILLDQLAEAGVPGPPLATGGWGSSHMTQPLQLGECPRATRCKVRLLALRQAPRRADEMGQARLPGLDPTLIHPIAIADQDPLPVVDEGGKGFFGATWMNHIESYPLTGHHPEPLQRVETVPRGFINIVD